MLGARPFNRAVSSVASRFSAILVCQPGQKFSARNKAKQLRRRNIRFNHAQICHAHKRDRSGRSVEERAISSLDFAKLPIVLLALLLHQRKARPEFGNRLKVLSDSDEARLPTELDGRVLKQKLATARQSLIDGEAGRVALALRSLDCTCNLPSHVGGNGVNPPQAPPLLHRLSRKRLGGHGVPDHAPAVDGQRDVRTKLRIVYHVLPSAGRRTLFTVVVAPAIRDLPRNQKVAVLVHAY